jgi:asparagine synthase (glutamine-hydrolysing)
MCGLTGFINSPNSNYSSTTDLLHVLTNMLKTIQTRGPDSSGTWHNNEIYLGHNRLSIVDLTEAGHQPMVSLSSRYVIAYNGEIYNTQELRLELHQNFSKNYPWRGHSDTEVILAMLDYYGLEQTLIKLVGMFALVIIDNLTKEIHLVRDHLGVKPLYYGIFNQIILFGSQIKSFIPHPAFKKELNEQAIALYFKYNYIPAPYAIYNNCYKLEPGQCITFKNGVIIKKYNYFSMQNIVATGRANILNNSKEEIINIAEELLINSVNSQMLADVPVGVFLSGGIDSSLVAALAQQHSSKPIKTFTIGFNEPDYNEANFALNIAKHLGTDHIEEYMPINKAMDIIPEIPEYCDEPLGDASEIPTLLVSKLARKHVKVVLSGDGGDEFFAGYSRYLDVLTLRKLIKYCPRVFKNLGITTINLLPKCILKLLGSKQAFKLQMLSRALAHNSVEQIYNNLFDFWPEISNLKRILS